jgi:hypothetical protein
MYGIDKPPRGSPTIFQILALAAATILVLGLRRPDQFRHPYLWVEDATVLQAYVERGLASIFEPVMGYYILPSKILDLAAFKLSILHAPAIALVLTALFTVAVVIAIAFSPTHLRWPCACAMTPLLVPTDPEIFAVGLYAFWWSGLLLVVALLWDSKRDRQWLRATYLVLGGLSTPIIVPVSGLLVVRAALDRQKCEFVASVIALIAAAVQLLSLGMDVTHKVSMQSEYSTFGISLLAFTKFMS